MKDLIKWDIYEISTEKALINWVNKCRNAKNVG